MKSQRWQLMSGFAPLWHVWEDEVVVLDRFSGDTHFLDAVSAALIQFLTNSPFEQQSLIEQMAVTYVCEADADFVALIQARLQGLAQLGVIECLPD